MASTHDAENVGTVKASELMMYARIVLAALGVPVDGPTMLLTDNLSNQRVAQNAQSSARSRYYLIRSTCLHQRVADGSISVAHIPDAENPSDFLTKSIPSDKTEASIRYALGRHPAYRLRRPHPAQRSQSRGLRDTGPTLRITEPVHTP